MAAAVSRSHERSIIIYAYMYIIYYTVVCLITLSYRVIRRVVLQYNGLQHMHFPY